MTLQELQAARNNPNVIAFLNLLAESEGVKLGYKTGFGNKPIASLADHPRTLHTFTETTGKKNKTSAAGRYQFTQKTWDGLAKKLKLNDFGPEAQDLGAIELIREKDALADVINGNFKKAISKLGSTWASLSSSPYNQPKNSANKEAVLLTKYQPTGSAAMNSPMTKVAAEAAPQETAFDIVAKATNYANPVAQLEAPKPFDQVAEMQVAAMNQAAPDGGSMTPWYNQVTNEAAIRDAQSVHEGAIAGFFGENPVPQIEIPNAIEDSINQYLAQL